MGCCLPVFAAAMPVSHSMAQCSALTYAISIWREDTELADQSNQWFELAFDLAKDEGVAQPFETLTNIANDAENAWLSKGQAVQFSGAFKDWTSYCTALGEAHGMEFRKP